MQEPHDNEETLQSSKTAAATPLSYHAMKSLDSILEGGCEEDDDATLSFNKGEQHGRTLSLSLSHRSLGRRQASPPATAQQRHSFSHRCPVPMTSREDASPDCASTEHATGLAFPPQQQQQQLYHYPASSRLDSPMTSTPRSSGSAPASLRLTAAAAAIPSTAPAVVVTPHSSLGLGCGGGPNLEDPVQSTTDDASVSKLSAVTVGYYEDPYLQYIVRRPARRPPLINRGRPDDVGCRYPVLLGYFVRVAALRKAISTFLNALHSMDKVQLVNLGAGLDTTYFWVQDFWGSPTVKFFEIDFFEVITKKLVLLTKKAPLWQCISRMPGARPFEAIEMDWKNEGPIVLNDTLTLIPADLRQCDRIEALLGAAGFDASLPTLFLSECALVYVQAAASDAIIQWAAKTMRSPSAFVMYEQMNPHDAFGKTMISNLELRGCPLLSIHDYPTMESQKTRFLKFGWDAVTIADMNQIYDKFLDKYEIFRIQGLELFDEIEEWRLIQAHYFVLVAVLAGASHDDAKLAIQETPLNALAHLWEENSVIQEDMPRFSTQELRQYPVRSPLMVPTSHLPTMGMLSPLVRPEATSHLLHDFPELTLTRGGEQLTEAVSRKWSLNLDSS